MESQVSLVSCLVFSFQPDEADKIVVPVFLIVWSEEEDGGEDGSNIDQLGVGWLAVFVLLQRAWKILQAKWCQIWPVRIVVNGLSVFVDGLSAEVNN